MAVIPPIVVDKFTCSGNGLLYEGHARESPADLRAMIYGRTPISDNDKYVPPISSQQLKVDGSHIRPKSWWLAQTLLYGLPGSKSSTIAQLRERLQTALQERKGMVVPEKILNMEVDTNKEFSQLNSQVASRTQPSTSKGKAKATDGLPAPKSSQPKAPAKGKEPKETRKEIRKVEEKPKPRTTSAPGPSRVKATSDKKESTTKKTVTSRTTREAPVLGSTKGGAWVKQPTRKAGDQPPVKREKREREYEMELDLWPEYEEPYPEPPRPTKRARHQQPTGPFAWLSGTYQIEAPVISQGWDVGHYFKLIVSIPRLTPHLLLVEFDFGVVHGVMRSRAPIETRADGAYATFEWCGRDAEQFEGVINYHRPGMTGYLKFARHIDGTHTVRGKIQDLSAVGDAEFVGIWASPDTSIRSEWGDFSERAYQYAMSARWG